MSNNQLIHNAIRNLKRLGPFHYRASDHDPHPLNCSLAGRVSHIFGLGMTSSIQLCREAGEDPDFQEPKAPVCQDCGEDAEFIDWIVTGDPPGNPEASEDLPTKLR